MVIRTFSNVDITVSFKLFCPRILMPKNAEVHIWHGKYPVAGIYMNRDHRLRGLQEQLSKVGHTAYLHELEDFNEIVEIEVNKEIVFRCKVLDFQFGSDGELDPLCKAVVDSVNNAY
ncbi:unnamed protein product [Trichobilharzia szidati]|nr:unnamed protein product [Trichobilharzia szidati]